MAANQQFLSPQQQQALLMSFYQQQQANSLNNTQGLFSTYPARLKRSDDNALLLPASYLTTKRSRVTGGSDEEDFDESDDDSILPMRVTRGAAAAVAAPMVAAPGASADLEKVARKRLSRSPLSTEDIERVSTAEEVLVPIRLQIDQKDIKLRDVFLWNMNEPVLTPEMFAETLCTDLKLPYNVFGELIVESIRTQVTDFAEIEKIKLPDNTRVAISLDLQIGKVNLRDQFEWDLGYTSANAPEVFSRQLASELGLGGEYVAIIAHAIREQIYQHKKKLLDDDGLEVEISDSLASAFRKIEEAPAWTPHLEELSNEELEKQLVVQERSIRRLRRENRSSRSRRRGSVTPSWRMGSNAGTPS